MKFRSLFRLVRREPTVMARIVGAFPIWFRSPGQTGPRAGRWGRV